MNDDSNYKEYQEIYQPIKVSLSSNDLNKVNKIDKDSYSLNYQKQKYLNIISNTILEIFDLLLNNLY